MTTLELIKFLILQENNATSVAWNSQFEDMLCFSGNELLNIKIGNCPANQIKFSVSIWVDFF